MSERWMNDADYIVDMIVSGKIDDEWFAEEFWQVTGGIKLPEDMDEEGVRLCAVLIMLEYGDYLVDGTAKDVIKKRLGL